MFAPNLLRHIVAHALWERAAGRYENAVVVFDLHAELGSVHIGA